MWWKPPRPFTKWERVGRLTMLWESESRVVWHHRAVYEKCICDCWTVKYILRWHIRHGKVKSCWCLASELWREKMTKLSTKHGFYWTRIYKIFHSMNWRCKYSNTDSYNLYWWRWIKCEWDNFEEFYKDMGASYEEHVKQYWESDTTIDRINNDGNYCKENCRRATRKEQQNNRSCNKIIIYKWNEYTQQELCDYMKIPKYVFMTRRKLWWSVERAIEEPIHKRM